MNASTILLAVGLTTLLATIAAGVVIGLVSVLQPGRLATAPASPTIAGQADASPPRAASWSATLHIGVVVSLVVLLAALVARTFATGHAPWSNLHEFSGAFATAVLAVYLVLERTAPIRGLAPFVALLAAALVGFALTLDDRIDPLVPALQQPLLLTIHVGAAVTAYAVSAVAFVAALAEIVGRRAPELARVLPSPELSRAVGHRAVLIGFPILTAAIALGTLWANMAWRSYWSNDPKELAAAATWFVFAAYLHVAGRRDSWAAAAPWLIVLGFAGVLFTYIGAGLVFVGEHSYATP
jgi:cytochrome c-type biogenesis protein CcsB